MPKKKTKKWLVRGGLTLAFVVLFMILYVLSALSGLRFFIPHYFSIAGTPFDSKSYLLVLQNNNELRPAGGKIMAYGSVTFNNGAFSDIEVNNLDESIVDHEYIAPPYPLDDGYTFFDANYDADFKETANELLTMYKITNPDAEFDGVVGLNVNVLKDILDIIGDVNVDEELVNSANIFEKLENSDNETLREISKRIISKSFWAVLSWRDLSDMFVRNFNEKHIQLYIFDEGFQSKLDAKGWSGTWPDELEGDFLATIEANLGENQINKYINRSLDYRLYLCDPSEDDFCDYTGKIAYTIEHIDRSPEAENYYGYIRFYFPKNTDLKSANAQIHYEDNEEYSVVGSVVNLNPGDRKTVEITVELPEDIFDQETYNLYIPKQSGTTGDSYSVIIETPNGTEIESRSFDIHENIASWQGALLKDKVLSLSVTKP
jgi:hypothetical protein